MTKDFVCNYCAGPVKGGWPQCYGCKDLFLSPGVPSILRSAAVPMTSVLNVGPWYSALINYKGLRPSLKPVLASIAYHFLKTHAARIAEMLGGEASMITVVPSKRGVPYEKQPLRAALSLLPPIAEKLQHTLVHSAAGTYSRRTYNPDVFSAGPASVRGARVVLIEDTWVTGATSISAAGALFQLGAVSVVVFPIARVVNHSYWLEEHPYRTAMTGTYRPFDTGAWPR